MRELQRAAEIIATAENPIALVGNGAIRAHAGRALRDFVGTTGIPVAETFMAKGLLDYEDPHALGTVGLQSRDYAMAGFEDADVVIAIGYDLVEHAPEHWNPRGDKRIVVIDTVAAEIDEFFMPEVELIGDIAHVLSPPGRRAAAGRTDRDRLDAPARRSCSGALADAADDDALPDAPAARPVRHPRRARPRRPAGLRRRPAQAVDRADVPRPRARHRADRQRPGRHGLRAADGDRRQARPPATATSSRSAATAAS